MLTKNADPNSYGIGFDEPSQFLLPIGEWGKNAVFGIDNSSSRHTDNRNPVLGESPTDGLDDTTITVEDINLSQ